MIKSYINKIKANISIYASKKTSNILDGSYKSIYKGRSLNFEDLREYVIGDNIKDIDWKASARSEKILVRQYIAEKKHNIMLVLDIGKKMRADTSDGVLKKEIAIMSAGTMAYLASKNGDYVGATYDRDGLISYFPFKEGLITGFVFVLGRSILLLLFGFILSFVGKGESLLDGISLIISLLTIIIFLISLFRMKFKFAFSFMFTNEVLLTLIIKIFY